MNLIVFFLSLHYSKCLCYLLALVDRYAVNHAYCFFVQLCSFWCSWVESSLHDVRRTQHCRIEAVQALSAQRSGILGSARDELILQRYAFWFVRIEHCQIGPLWDQCIV